MSAEAPRIWALLGERTGDNNQVLALAEALGSPFETRTLTYNLARALSVKLGPTLATLDRRSRSHIAPPWPDLILAIGRRSVPVGRWIKKQAGGRSKLVLLGHPRVSPGLFDLVITTRQYPVPPGSNVVLLPLAMSRFSELPKPTQEEAKWVCELRRPVRLLAVGGATKYWRLSSAHVLAAAERLQARDGSLVVVTSRRTDPEVLRSLRNALRPESRLVEGAFPRFATLLGAADEIYVTGDSISMLSESILTGKPVGLIPIEQDEKGRRKLGATPHLAGPDARRRDLRRFWNHLQDKSLIGTVEAPVAANVENPVDIAVRAVRELLNRP